MSHGCWSRVKNGGHVAPDNALAHRNMDSRAFECVTDITVHECCYMVGVYAASVHPASQDAHAYHTVFVG